MTSNVVYTRPYGNWQFSLRSLMFLTMVVAVCAALVHISVPLAVLLIPLFAAGLVRTVRVVTSPEVDSARVKPSGLFVAFCRSIALMLAMIGVGMTAIAFAGVSGALITVMVVIHIVRATGVLYQPVMDRARRTLVRLGRWCWATASRISPAAILRWFQAHSVASTLSLIAVFRQLVRQWWSMKTHASRTDPL